MEYQRKQRDWSWYVGIFFIVFFLFLYFQLINDKLSYLRGGDAASYILLAKSLASGLGFSDFNLPGNPPHTQYPPLFPLLLSPIIAIFGYNFMWMRLLVIGFGLASLYIIRLFFLERVSKTMSFVLVFLVGTSFFVLTLGAEILPEIVYLFFSMLTLYLFERNIDRKPPVPYARYLPLLAPLMYFTKFIGVTICFAVICVLLLKIKSEVEERAGYIKRLVSFLVIGVLPFIIWFLRNSFYARGVSTYQSIMFQSDYYDASLGQAGIGAIFGRMMDNISMYIFEVPGVFLTYMESRKALPAPVLKGFLIAILIIFLIGFLRDLILKRGVKDFYTFFYLAILMVWPTYGTGDALRYLMPLIPLIYYYFFRGFVVVTFPGTFFRRGEAGLAAESGSGNRLPMLVFFPVCILILLNLAQISGRLFSPTALRQIVRSSFILKENLFKRVESVELGSASTPFFELYVPCYHRYLKGAKRLAIASGPGDIIMTRKPEVVSLVSGRYAIRFPYSSNEKLILGFMEENGVTHILLDNCYKETKKYVLPVTEKYNEKFTVWLAADGTHSGILKLNK